MRDDDPIWYASYGSNCHGARFEVYLTGGAATGANVAEPGARDPTPPHTSRAYWFSTRVRFLGDAVKWGGGGIAFLDHPEPGRRAGFAPGRLHLITKGQFDDVVAQESRRPTTPLPVADLEVGVVTPVGDCRYDGLLALPPVDDTPVVTFTSPAPLTHLDVSAPSAAYLGTIVRGLCELHDRPVEELADRLIESPGVALGWDRDAIVELAK